MAPSSVDLVALIDQTWLTGILMFIGAALNASSRIAWVSGACSMYVSEEGYHSPAFLLRSANASRSTSTSGQFLYGHVHNVWSRKVLLLAGLAIFLLGSLAASLAQTAVQVVIFRAIMGIGGRRIDDCRFEGAREISRHPGKVTSLSERFPTDVNGESAVVGLAYRIGAIVRATLASRSVDSWYKSPCT